MWNILLALSIGVFSCNIHCDKAPFEPTQEDLEQMLGGGRAEKMESMMQEMQNFYENLPKEEKEKFEAELVSEVQKEQEKLAAMSPDEQKNYMESAFAQFDDLDLDDLFAEDEDSTLEEYGNYDFPSQEKPIKEEQKKQKEEDKQQKKKTIKERLSKIDEIVKLMTSIEETLSSITKGAQTVVDSWKQKKYIQTSWDQLTSSLGELKSKLEKLKSTDPKTEKYYFLDDTKKADKLFGNLDTLLSVLRKYEPNIETVEVAELQEVKLKNEAAKSATKGFINFLSETSKTTLNLINELIKTFDPEAKKIVAEEERLRKMGERPVRKRPGRTVVTGKPDRPGYGYNQGYGDDYGYGWPGDSDYYSPSSPYSDYTPSYSPHSASGSDGDTSQDTSEKPKSSKGKKTSAKTADDKKKKTQTIVPSKGDAYKEAIKKQYPELHDSIKNLTTSVEDSVKDLKKSNFFNTPGILSKKTDVEKNIKEKSASQAKDKQPETVQPETSAEDEPDQPEMEETELREKKPVAMNLEELKEERTNIKYEVRKVKDEIENFSKNLSSFTKDLKGINEKIKKIESSEDKKLAKKEILKLEDKLVIIGEIPVKKGKLKKCPVAIEEIVEGTYKIQDQISSKLQKEFLEKPEKGYNLYRMKEELINFKKELKKTEAI